MKPVLIFISILFKSALSQNRWNYQNYAQDEWTDEYETCSGQHQSPIAIFKADLIYNSQLAPIQLKNYDQITTWALYLEKFSVIFESANGFLNNASITGSDFDEEFFFLQFHFHWGSNNSVGSEHQIFGKSFPLEVHLVHRSLSGKLAVLGFEFEISQSDNKALDILTDRIRNINNSTGNKQANFSLMSFLPSNSALKSYFRYQGSLTTPPCTEGVIWTMFEAKIPISEYQMSAFRASLIEKNYRYPQQLFNRTVYSSVNFKPSFSLTYVFNAIVQFFSSIWSFLFG